MPIYEYGCQECGKKTEAIQRVGEKHLKICPHCGGALKKLASAPAIQFKGSGWYITDYARARKEEKTASSDKGEEKAASSEKREEKAASSEKREEKAASSDRRESAAKLSEKKKEAKEKKTGKE